ncbi:MAG: hypothetical protein H6607_05350 [Flavobacteriales bacterium]|nr:hypothetical protein [Flavobacteriales bacterium]
MRKISDRYTALVLLFILLIVRLFVLFRFNLNYVDSDELINWIATRDMSQGLFYTPFYYGQFYSTNLEAFFASPLVYLGIPNRLAIPVVSNAIGFAPFVLLFFHFWRKKQMHLAIFSAAIGCLMPIEFHLITSLARGFTGGLLFFFSGFVLLFGSSNSAKSIGLSFIGLSVLVNPNSILLLFPLSILLVYNHLYQNKYNLKLLILPILIFTSTFLWLHFFKRNYPELETHVLPTLKASFDIFATGIQKFDYRFRYLVPFFPAQGWVILVLFAMILLFRKKLNIEKSLLLAFIAAFVAVFATFAINKTDDGMASVYFPYSRMYLAIPFLFLIPFIFQKALNQRFIQTLSFLAVLSAIIGLFRLNKVIKYAVNQNPDFVTAISHKQLCQDCEAIKKLYKKSGAEALVFYSKSDVYNYGCNAIDPQFKSVLPLYERRYWEWEKHNKKVFDRILFLDEKHQFADSLKVFSGQLLPFQKGKIDAFLLQNNTYYLHEIYAKNNFEYHPKLKK